MQSFINEIVNAINWHHFIATSNIRGISNLLLCHKKYHLTKPISNSFQVNNNSTKISNELFGRNVFPASLVIDGIAVSSSNYLNAMRPVQDLGISNICLEQKLIVQKRRQQRRALDIFSPSALDT